MDSNKNKLRRPKSDRVVFGVCSGLGKFFGINPTWFRLAFILAFLPGGVPALLPYLILWIIIPTE